PRSDRKSPARCSPSQARASPRNASSVSVNRNSTLRLHHAAPGAGKQKIERVSVSLVTRSRYGVLSQKGERMRLGLQVGYSGAQVAIDIEQIREAESLGYHSVWTAEAWGSDAVTPLAWI